MNIRFCIYLFTVNETEKSGDVFRKRKNSGKRQRLHLLYDGAMTS
jgi:hypothetical protein